MKTKQQLTMAIATALFAVTLLTISPALFAQVKIGTNPTVIGANSNLEVEASAAGRKTSIDKLTGQVTIKDGTEGVSKILTSDANGGANWQKMMPSSIAPFPKGRLNGGATSSALVSGVQQQITYTTLDFSEGGVTKVGDGLQVPISGYYFVKSSTNFGFSTGCNGVSLGSIGTGITVNGVIAGGAGSDDRAVPRSYDYAAMNVVSLIHLNANDIVSNLAGVSFVTQAGCVTSIEGGDLIVVYQP